MIAFTMRSIGFIALIIAISLTTVRAETDKGEEQDQILVIGSSTIVGGNVANARRTALSAALIKGVEAYLTKRLGAQGMTNNFPRLVRDVLPHAREEVQNFNILAEEQIDNQYKLLVRLKVNEKLMEEKLREAGLVLMEGPPLKILFLVSQIKLPEQDANFWWNDPENNAELTPTELALHRVFQERGFQPINRLVSTPEASLHDELKMLDLSEDSAFKWGGLFSADVVIFGKCEITGGESVSIFLKALDIEGGTAIYEDRQSVRIERDDEGAKKIVSAIEQAISRIVKEMGPLLLATAKAPDTEITELEIVLTGLTKLKQIQEIKDFLMKNIAGTESVAQTRAGGNSVTLAVRFSGDIDQFLNLITSSEKFPFLAEVGMDEDQKIRIEILNN
ncbi:hypothetical protein ACFL9T_01725 [Thermodesulfobacteriota bacterium]